MTNGKTSALDAQQTIKGQIKSLEKAKNYEAALDMMRILGVLDSAAREEFCAMSMVAKCCHWRDVGKFSEPMVVQMAGSFIEDALGEGWRKDPGIRAAMKHLAASESL